MTDAFNAIAEPRRREIIDVLVDGKTHPVGEMVERLRIPQPAVSKHLGVLREVGIVSASRVRPDPGSCLARPRRNFVLDGFKQTF